VAYEVLSHTADTGLAATAPDLSGLISELAEGMFGILAARPGPSDGDPIEISVWAETPEDLVVDVLSHLLYISEVENLLLRGFETTMDDRRTAHVRARSIPLEVAEVEGPAIKAVTYHDLVVTKTDDGWRGRVYFDV
jgi:SHS2 domain-containing protein